MKRPCVLARYDELPVELATATAAGWQYQARRSGVAPESTRRANENVARNAAGDKYPISISSIRSKRGLSFGTRMMLTIRRVRAGLGGMGVQTARYRVDNPPADGYKRRTRCFLPLSGAISSETTDACILTSEIALLNDPNFAGVRP